MHQNATEQPSLQQFLAPTWRAVLAGLVSATMLAAAYAIHAPARWSWLAWIGLVPLFLATRQRRHRQVYAVVIPWVLVYVFGVADMYYLLRLIPVSMPLLAVVLMWAMMVSETQLLARWFPRWGWLLVPGLWTAALLIISQVVSVLQEMLPEGSELLFGPHATLMQIFTVTNGYGLVFLTVLVNSGLTELLNRLERRKWWTVVVAVFLALGVFSRVWMTPRADWSTSTPELQGMNSRLLSQLQQHIEKRLPHIRSVLIVRHGHLVFEAYFQGSNQSDYHHLWAATNSFTSALIGIGLQEGYIQSLDQMLMSFFPQYDAPDLDTQTAEITLEHLLTMTSGFAVDSFPQWTSSADWIRDTIELPVLFEPGQRFHFNNSASHLLSGILTQATDMSVLEFADQHLFRPLGISKRLWTADPQGNNIGAAGLSLTARDMAKFGLLYLNRGVWDGKQIIPADFIQASTQKQNAGGFPELVDHGYLWWVTTIEGHSAFFAGGYGGQYIYVVPDLDIVIVIASDSERSHVENRAIIGDFIIPAISD